MVWPMVAAAAVQVVGGLMAQAQSAKTAKEQKKLLEQARAEWDKIEDPQVKAEAFQTLKSQGVLTPEAEKSFNVPDSEYASIQVDPNLKQAQMDALAKLQELGRSGGVDDVDKANIERARQNYAAQAASQQANVTEALARRGVSGGGMELAQRQMSAQNAANQMGNTEAQVQAEARRRALDAILQGGQLGGQIRSQEQQAAEAKAAAMDRINQFRTQNSIGLEQRRVDAANTANAANLSNTQRIADANVGFKNAEIAARNAQPQQRFQNQVTIAQGKSGQLGQAAAAVADKGAKDAQMFGGLITGVGQLGAAYGQNQQAERAADAEALSPADYKTKWGSK